MDNPAMDGFPGSRLHLELDGTVSGVNGGFTVDRGLLACVYPSIRTWKFPKPKKRTLVSLKLDFVPN